MSCEEGRKTTSTKDDAPRQDPGPYSLLKLQTAAEKANRGRKKNNKEHGEGTMLEKQSCRLIQKPKAIRNRENNKGAVGNWEV